MKQIVIWPYNWYYFYCSIVQMVAFVLRHSKYYKYA